MNYQDYKARYGNNINKWRGNEMNIKGKWNLYKVMHSSGNNNNYRRDPKVVNYKP